MPHVTADTSSRDDEKVNQDIVSKNKNEITPAGTNNLPTADPSDQSQERVDNQNSDDDDDPQSQKPPFLNNEQQSATEANRSLSTQGTGSEISLDRVENTVNDKKEKKSGDIVDRKSSETQTTGTHTDTGNDNVTTKSKESIMNSIETRHSILRQQIESIQRKLVTTSTSPSDYRPYSTMKSPPIHDNNNSTVSDHPKASKRSESKRLTNNSGITQHLIQNPEQDVTQDRNVAGTKNQSSKSKLKPFHLNTLQADVVPMSVLSTTIPTTGDTSTNQRNVNYDDGDDDNNDSRMEVELVDDSKDNYKKTGGKSSDPYSKKAAQSINPRFRPQEMDGKGIDVQPLTSAVNPTSRQEHNLWHRKRGLSSDKDDSGPSNIEAASLAKQTPSPSLKSRDAMGEERNQYRFDGPNPVLEATKASSHGGRHEINQIFLSKNEVAQLAHDIWSRMGYASIGSSNDVRATQAKIEIAREFFRSKGYLYLDPHSKHGKTKEKLAYLANATPNDKQRMAILDSKAIKMAVSLCERRLYDTHGPGAASSSTSESKGNTAEMPPDTHPRDAPKNTNFWSKVSQSWASAQHVSPNEQRYNESRSMKYKGEALPRMNHGMPLTDVDRGAPSTNPNDRSKHIPREVALSSQEIVELSSKIQRAVVESVQGTSENPDFRRIKFMVAHQYFKEKGYLHLPGGASLDEKREYPGSARYNQHLRNIDNVSVSRAINKCDRYHHEKLMQLSKQSMNSQLPKLKVNRDPGPRNTSMHPTNVIPNPVKEVNASGTYSRNSRSVPNVTVPDVRNAFPPQRLSEHELAILIQAKEKELYSALNLVGKSLSHGPWPSPVRPMEPQSIRQRNKGTTLAALLGSEIDKDVLDLIDDDPDESEEQSEESEAIYSSIQAHRDHMYDVAASLKQFTHDVIRPKILEDLRTAIAMAQEDGDGYDNGPLKIFLGALLMLREVITQNAGEIFGPSATLNGREADFDGTLRPNHDSGAYETENVTHASKVLATAVILYGLAELEQPTNQFSKQFLQMVSEYDGGNDSFADYYHEITQNVTGVLASEQPLSEWESIAWRMSANYNREKHPLIQENRKRKKRATPESNGNNRADTVKPKSCKSFTIALADPNTVHISIFENNRDAD